MGVTADIFAKPQSWDAFAMLRVIFDSAPVGITLASLDGTFVQTNPAFRSMLGYTEEELRRHTGYDLTCDEADRARTRAFREELFAGRREHYEIEKRLRAKDGKAIWVHVKGTLVRDEQNRPHCTVAMVKDITERKAATEALRASEKQLRQVVQERASLSRDLHDNIVQSLYAIGMGLENCAPLIQRDPQYVTAQLAQAIGGLVIRDVRHCIVGNDGHLLSGLQLRAELATLVREIGERSRPRFRFHVDEEALTRVRPEEAQQILYIAREALSNALQHSGAKRGMLMLRCAQNAVLLEVSDDGTGFDGRLVCDEKALGLRNMDARARQIGASFECQSRPGHGTRIFVQLPAHASPP